MEKRSRLVLVGLAIVVAAFLYLVYVAGTTFRISADRTAESRVRATVVGTK